MYKYSVIIPIYNVEKYLKETLDSIVNQSVNFKENIQLILVDDGSIDNSFGICKRFLSQYPNNVILLQQQNKGVGAARNAGVKCAAGEYVLFVDSDDLLNLDALYILNKEIEAIPDAEMFTFNHKQVFENQKLKNITPVYKRKKYHKKNWDSGKDLFVDLVKANDFYVNVWMHLFKKSFLDRINLRFAEGIVFEDQPYTITAYLLAEKSVYIDKNLYTYRVRQNSICTDKNLPKRCYDNFYVAKLIYSFIAKYDLIGDYLDCLQDRISVRVKYSVDRFYEATKEQKNKIISMCTTPEEKKEFFLIVDASSRIRKKLEKSWVYRAGNFIMYIPKKIRIFFS